MIVLAVLFLVLATLPAGFLGLVCSSAIAPHAYTGRDGEGAAGLVALVVIAVGSVSVVSWAISTLMFFRLRKRERVGAKTAYVSYALPLIAFVLAFGLNWLWNRFLAIAPATAVGS